MSLTFLKSCYKSRRKNLTQRKMFKAEEILENLLRQKMLFPKKARKRLAMIKENWRYFTAFYHITDCPATNNALENFYSTSLKTHRKKQLRSDKGIRNNSGHLFCDKSSNILIYFTVKIDFWQ